MNDQDETERAWSDGHRAAWASIAQLAARELEGMQREASVIIAERSGAIAKLRELCALIGDNNWPDNLNLVDVIENHLLLHVPR